MKKVIPVIIIFFILMATGSLQAQFYTLSGGEMVFSFSTVTIGGTSAETKLRWSPVFNFGSYANYDFSDRFGVFSGIDVKNIGFIYQDPNNNNYKVIQRTYNLGIPFAIKVGQLDKFFIYGGYQIEFPFLYKHKSWDTTGRSGAKTKFTGWFSDATPHVMNTVFAGIQFYGGLNLKFRYYLDNFINPDYVRNGQQINAGMEAQVWSISLAASLFKNTRFYLLGD